jgi:RNA recognition motif-containing protein
LRSIFEEFGEIESAKVTMDRLTGRSKGFGFVEMPSNSEADQAIIFTKEKDIDLFYRGR